MVGIGPIVILFVTMAFRKARNIKPMATPAFSVMRVLQQAIQQAGIRIIRFIFKERFNLIRSWGNTQKIEISPAN